MGKYGPTVKSWLYQFIITDAIGFKNLVQACLYFGLYQYELVYNTFSQTISKQIEFL